MESRLNLFIDTCRRMSKSSFVSEFINDYNDEESLNLAKQAYEIVYNMENKSILKEASDIRSGSRNTDYGDAVENFKNIANMASAMLGKRIYPKECVIVLMAVKLCRERFHHKRDNLVDLCGYADILEEIYESEENKQVYPLSNPCD